jgi:hypothetical protein
MKHLNLLETSGKIFASTIGKEPVLGSYVRQLH